MIEREYTINRRNKGSNKVFMQDFDGVNEFASWIDNTPDNKLWTGDAYLKQKLEQLAPNVMYDDPEWRGATNYDEARDKLLNGVNVREIHRARASSFTSERRKIARAVSGCRPNVPVYLTGQPRNMITMRPQPERRSLRVFVDCCVPWHVEASEITAAGEKIVSILAKLDAVANYDLVAGNLTYNPQTGDIYGCNITIKTSGKPFSASRVSFCLTSPAFLRVFDLRWCGKNPNTKPMSSFGKPLSYHSKELFDAVIKKHHKDTIVLALEGVISDGENYITKTFKEAGITL